MAYPQEYRTQAVQLALEIGPYHAAQELGLSRTTLYNWFLAGCADGLLPNMASSTDTSPPASSDMQDAKRLRELEKEVQRLRRVNRILLNTIDALTSKQDADAEAS